MNCDVLFALVGDVRRDSRSLRQLRAFGNQGWSVVALTFGPPSPDVPPLPDSVRLRVLERPPGNGPFFFWRVHRLFQKAARQVKASVYHAGDLYVLPALCGAARHNSGRIVYDARELFPHVGATAGRPWARWFWQAVEGRYIHQADCVLTVSQSIARHLSACYDIERPEFVPNVPPHQRVAPTNRLRERFDIPMDRPLVLYQGAFKPGRGCDVLINAMQHVDDASLVLLGNGPLEDDLRAQVQHLDVADRVYFHPWVSPDELLHYTVSADVGVALIENKSLSLYLSLPNKLFQYLMAGVPVLVSNFPEMRRVVTEHDVGRVVNPGAPRAVAEALKQVTSDNEARQRWKRNTQAVFETFCWEEASKTMLDAYKALLSESS